MGTSHHDWRHEAQQQAQILFQIENIWDQAQKWNFQHVYLICLRLRWAQMGAASQLWPKKVILGIDQGQEFPQTNFLGPSCLGSAIQRYLGCWNPRWICRRCGDQGPTLKIMLKWYVSLTKDSQITPHISAFWSERLAEYDSDNNLSEKICNHT